jgi:hypothetical protein
MPEDNIPQRNSDPHIELGQMLPLFSGAIWLFLAYGSITRLASGMASLVLCVAMAAAFFIVLLRSVYTHHSMAESTFVLGLVGCSLLLLAPVFALDGSFSGAVESYQCLPGGTACWQEIRNALHAQAAICVIAAALAISTRSRAR